MPSTRTSYAADILASPPVAPEAAYQVLAFPSRRARDAWVAAGTPDRTGAAYPWGDGRSRVWLPASGRVALTRTEARRLMALLHPGAGATALAELAYTSAEGR